MYFSSFYVYMKNTNIKAYSSNWSNVMRKNFSYYAKKWFL